MAKDPAFLFYPGDWIVGTTFMSFEEKGQYITLLCVMHQSGRLSDSQIRNVLRTDVITDELRSKFKKDNEGKWYNERLEVESNKRKAYTESRRNSRLKSNEDEVRIYLIKDIDSGNFKIGSSVNPLRRFAEMCNQKNPAITIGNRNYELFWVSEKCKRSIEKELHDKFSDKNITGEWFSLAQSDINYITTTHKGIFQRTSERTVNENAIENENVIINAGENKNSLIEKLFNDESFVSDLQMTHRGKDIKLAFEECYIHHSNAPNPPATVGEWKQKLNTWLSITKHPKNGNTKDKRTDHLTSLAKDFAERHGTGTKA